jgi:ribonuclease HII
VANFEIEKSFFDRGYRLIAGVDEVGRGALFGPVVATAVILPSAWISGEGPLWLRQTNDSKLLSPKKRMELARFIRAQAVAVASGFSTSLEIDQQNIFRASLEAMKRAVARLPITPDFVLVDGFEIRDCPLAQKGIPGGDRKSYSIAAASIVAKVLRDRMMSQYDRRYRGYALGRNKGYGTEAHFRALEGLGPTPLHRKSFKLQAEKKLFSSS